MAGITGADVKKGDILLCKSYSLMPAGTHFGIRAGRSVAQAAELAIVSSGLSPSAAKALLAQ
jgi:hypothetical protein